MVEVVTASCLARPRVPERASETLAGEAGPAVGCLLAHLDCGCASPPRLGDDAHDVVRRRFDELVPGAARPAVRAEDHEVVREAGHAHALVGADARSEE